MDGLGTAVVAYRLAVATVVVVGPTLLFLGLWRFLMWLRDDALVARLVAEGVIDPEEAPDAATAGLVEELGARRCSACGTTNPPGAAACRECSADL